MTDIIERLESYAVGPPEGQELMREAAAYIEKLHRAIVRVCELGWDAATTSRDANYSLYMDSVNAINAMVVAGVDNFWRDLNLPPDEARAQGIAAILEALDK